MIDSGYRLDGKVIQYEIFNNGYLIYLEETPWIDQRGNVLYPQLSFEENAVLQIKGICGEELPPIPEAPPPLTQMERAILDTAVNTEYLVCLKDMGL